MSALAFGGTQNQMLSNPKLAAPLCESATVRQTLSIGIAVAVNLKVIRLRQTTWSARTLFILPLVHVLPLLNRMNAIVRQIWSSLSVRMWTRIIIPALRTRALFACSPPTTP
jgi:hypothetical protein